MKYPLNVDEYVQEMMSLIPGADDGDRAVFTAIGGLLNKAYVAGLEDGKNCQKIQGGGTAQ